jgi:hypothetical protein
MSAYSCLSALGKGARCARLFIDMRLVQASSARSASRLSKKCPRSSAGPFGIPSSARRGARVAGGEVRSKSRSLLTDDRAIARSLFLPAVYI